jgi:radical SAM enzyme (rSAM/lipoprotein system)
MKVDKLSLKKKIALNLFRKYRINQSKLHQLRYILWECTLRCNLNCLHCGSDCKKDSSLQDMPANDFLRAIDQLKNTIDPNNTMIVLTGGEALLRKDIEKIGISLYQRGFPWSIVTNGMLLNKQKLKSLSDAGLRSITISLDGLEDSHNWLRGNANSFRNAIAAIKLLPETVNLRSDVVTCINRRNFKELAQIRDLLINSGIKEWRVFTIFPVGRAKENPQLLLEPFEFRALFEFISQTRKEKQITLNYGCEGFLGSYEGEVRDNFFFCRAGINIASVLADGSFSACPNMRDNFIQGNIYTDNFAEVWESKYAMFRNKSWTKTGICSDCEFYKYCEGNGMHLRDEKKGGLLFCHLKRIKEGEAIGKRSQPFTPAG